MSYRGLNQFLVRIWSIVNGIGLLFFADATAVLQFTPTPQKPSLQLIKNVKPESPSAMAGLKEGDFVVKVSYFVPLVIL